MSKETAKAPREALSNIRNLPSVIGCPLSFLSQLSLFPNTINLSVYSVVPSFRSKEQSLTPLEAPKS